MENDITIALIQSSTGEDPAENLAAAVTKIGVAVRQGARVVCLQELFRSRYFPQREDTDFFRLAETIPGPTTDKLCGLARSDELVVVASIFEKRAPGIYHNTAVVIDANGEILGKYRKMHIPDDPCFYEKFYFTPGDLGFPAFTTRYGRIGVLVCWDQWFPEAARLLALSGAQIIFYPTAIGWLGAESRAARRAQLSAWEIVQRSHAVVNGVFVAAVNRVGKEEDLLFWGQSFVADPFGEIVARASAAEEEVLVAQCDLRKIDETRHHWPFLRDRRIDAYESLTRRFVDHDAG